MEFFDETPPEPSDPLSPEEAASEGALTAAARFFEAIAAGDTAALWDLFSDSARAYIINIGHERGMDFELASRLRAGTAAEQEMQDFLGDLLAGIQRDLTGVDLSRLALDSVAEPEAPMQVRVTFLVRLGPQLEGVQTAIPAGSLLMALEGSEWKVERLNPGPSQEGPADPSGP